MGEQYFTQRDGQKNCLMILTTKGCGYMNWNGKTVDLTPGTMTLIDCEKKQEYGTAPGCTWSFTYIHFASSQIEGYRKLLMDNLQAINLTNPEAVMQIFDRIYDIAGEAALSAYAEESHLISSLLTEMMHSQAVLEAGSASDTRMSIQRLSEYIRDHCTESLSLEELSMQSHLSKYHLIRVFSAQIGLTPGKYLHLCRINRAQQLLRTTSLPLGEISQAVGYSEQAIFNRHFRAFHGIAPGEYRRSCIIEIRDLPKT
ncbi:MAG: AraC family transcriptional regulator [Clostridia bacterium]|nr:AraC family transcriptional regulator [Clostridia bacterium]